ncbi:hypothetical protein SeMB42_g07343, partial [Synchytrium endobioticum]
LTRRVTFVTLRSKRSTSKEMIFPKFAESFADSSHPAHFVLEKVADIAATIVPTELQDTFDQLFWPPSALNKVYISITRAYHSCVFERLKSLFREISSCVVGDRSNQGLVAARALVWDFLVLFHTRDIEYRHEEGKQHESTKTTLPIVSGLSHDPLEAAYSGYLMKELQTQMEPSIAQIKAKKADVEARKTKRKPYREAEKAREANRKARPDDKIKCSTSKPKRSNDDDEYPPPVVESTNNVKNANQYCGVGIGSFEFVGNDIDHDDDCDQSPLVLIDFLGKAEKRASEFQMGWHNTERCTGATPRIEVSTTLALSSSNWHHHDFSSQSDDKGKTPMNAGSSTHHCLTQHAQGVSAGRSTQSISGSKEASKDLNFWRWL